MTSEPAPATNPDDDQSYASNCFGCSRTNPKGLGLRFQRDDDNVYSDFCLDSGYESYPGVAHGGIITLVLDEVMGRAALWDAGAFVLTSSLRTRFIAPLAIGTQYRCRARVIKRDADQIKVSAEIIDADEHYVATANGFFIAITESRTRGGMHGLDSEVSKRIMDLTE